MRSVFAKTLYDLRWTVAAFGVALGLIAFVILYVYPSVANTQSNLLLGLSLQNPKLSGTPDGYLNLELFSFLPLYLAIFVIIVTSGAVAGEDDEHTLAFLLTRPIARWRILLEKALAMLVALVVIVLLITAGTLLGALAAGVDIAYGQLGLAIILSLPYGLWLIGFGLCCSAVFRHRMTAALVVTAVVVAGYVLNSMSTLVSSLKSYNHASPIYYYNWGEPLLGRVRADHIAILLAAGALFGLLGLLAFQRREVTAG